MNKNRGFWIAFGAAITFVVLFVTLLLAPAMCAQAQTVGLQGLTLHTHSRAESRHTGRVTPPYRVITEGAYVRFDSDVTAGAFHNSYDAWSAHLGYTFERGPWALTVSGITGYASKFSALPSYRKGPVRLTLLPGIRGADTALSASYEIKLRD